MTSLPVNHHVYGELLAYKFQFVALLCEVDSGKWKVMVFASQMN